MLLIFNLLKITFQINCIHLFLKRCTMLWMFKTFGVLNVSTSRLLEILFILFRVTGQHLQKWLNMLPKYIFAEITWIDFKPKLFK